MTLLRSATLLALATMALSAAAQNPPNLVTNGGFETGDFTGWTVTGDFAVGTNDPGAGFDAHTGGYFASLSSFGGNNTLSQTIVTIPGRSYSLNFWAKDTNFDDDFDKTFTVSFGDQTSDLFEVPSQYQIYALSVTATSTRTTLTFSGQNGPGFYLLDDVGVFVNPVPEPASLAALGLGAVAVLRRRKRA